MSLRPLPASPKYDKSKSGCEFKVCIVGFGGGVAVATVGVVSCNIDVSNIPEIGKIFFVQNGVRKSKDEVLEKWNKTDFVKAAQSVESKGWLLDVLMCVEKNQAT